MKPDTSFGQPSTLRKARSDVRPFIGMASTNPSNDKSSPSSVGTELSRFFRRSGRFPASCGGTFQRWETRHWDGSGRNGQRRRDQYMPSDLGSPCPRNDRPFGSVPPIGCSHKALRSSRDPSRASCCAQPRPSKTAPFAGAASSYGESVAIATSACESTRNSENGILTVKGRPLIVRKTHRDLQLSAANMSDGSITLFWAMAMTSGRPPTTDIVRAAH
jgi:hypothetical protein